MAVLRVLGTVAVATATTWVTLRVLSVWLPLAAEPAVMLPVLVVVAVQGLLAGLLASYDLGRIGHWLILLLDHTWSLPNTVFGGLVGNLVYPWVGRPSRTQSAGRTWICYLPRGTSGFGTDVLQTLGIVNLGGAGQHERMHLLQSRIFGPTYLPLFAVSYVATATLAILFAPVGAVLRAAHLRDTWYLRPPPRSAVHGFFGWIYYATPFELWAYASGNP
ncbi:hypothetical protein [Cellulomonas sp. ATA003]|uniref:hypothetical protein n=1 Tax=Cellulomonas sp. ATA003 TaxID=3073064 RepID=UPI002873EA35|nr:hypothetical protein [Cellulomonas sp. ATA003]WNB87295.1 hypothetical protein REH70_09445 [Cellulomonas sp. ATA003]